LVFNSLIINLDKFILALLTREKIVSGKKSDFSEK